MGRVCAADPLLWHHMGVRTCTEARLATEPSRGGGDRAEERRSGWRGRARRTGEWTGRAGASKPDCRRLDPGPGDEWGEGAPNPAVGGGAESRRQRDAWEGRAALG